MPASTHPIIFHWIKQYPHNKEKLCDLCKNKQLDVTPLANYTMEHYIDLSIGLNSGLGIIDLSQVEKDTWQRVLKDQINGTPRKYQTWCLCSECVNWLVAGFMGERFQLAPPHNELAANLHPEQKRLSWVLFKRQSDPDTPLMMFTMSDFLMSQVIEQGKNILKSGNIK